MSETGHSWRRTFEATPTSAPVLRAWTRSRITHPQADFVIDELFVAVLTAEPAAVEVSLSTADGRARITVCGAGTQRPLQQADDARHRVAVEPAVRHGTKPDARGLWADLTQEETMSDRPRQCAASAAAIPQPPDRDAEAVSA